MLKFLNPPAGPDLSVVGTNLGPASVPMALVTVQPDGVASYVTLYSFLGPDGRARSGVYPGTYGMLVAAGRR